MQTDRQAKQIGDFYKKMIESASIINQYKSNPPADMTTDQVNAAIQKNKNYLALMLQKPYWENMDMSFIKSTLT